MIPLAFALLAAALPDGGIAIPRLPVTVNASAEALTITVGTTRLAPLPVLRDARGRLDVRQLRDKLRELAMQQPDVHALTLLRGGTVSADDVRRVTEACVAEHFNEVEVRDATAGPAPGPPAVLPPPPSEMTVFGSVDAAEIRRVVEQQRAGIDACVERARGRNPKLEGRVIVKFIISAAGTVVSAQVPLSTIEDEELGNCLTSLIRGCTFPKPKGGGVAIVNYPFAIARRSR